jgi:adenine deaminase
MATINTAEHFGVARDVGQIAPGRFADILLVSDLVNLVIDKVIVRGEVAAEAGQLILDLSPFPYPDWATHSVVISRQLGVDDFNLPSKSTGKVIANVIGIIENQAPTCHLRMEFPVDRGEIRTDIKHDIAKLALVERHKGTGKVQVGLVHGFGFDKPCAVGSTVAHDSHHMIVVGTNEADMAYAANELYRMEGGQVVVSQGQVIGAVDLKIAGLMSNKRAEVVANEAASVLRGIEVCGCTLNNPIMQLSLLGLVVIPELRISDLGLVDVTKFEFIPLLEE